MNNQLTLMPKKLSNLKNLLLLNLAKNKFQKKEKDRITNELNDKEVIFD
jgi:Leucine-rich repeat (LRR) protein